MSSSPSKYASGASMERKRSFDEGGLHIVEPRLSSDCVEERTARPAVQYVSGITYRSRLVHCRPLFLQVLAEIRRICCARDPCKRQRNDTT